MRVDRDKLAVNHRDKVYTLAGIEGTMTSGGRSPVASVKPDYELPVQNLHTHLTAQSLLTHDAIHI